MSVNVESVVALTSLYSQTARSHLTEALVAPQTIAPLPRVCAQLAELTAQNVPDAAHLARLIQSDPVLAGEVMRIANSAALRPRAAVVSLQQAVSWLGIAEVRNIGMAVTLRGEVFSAPGHEPESEQLWREAWLTALWAKEIARDRRTHVESAYLAALMHRTGAALALKILARFEADRRTVTDAHTFAGLVEEFEPAFGRLLMSAWRLPQEVQDGATDWRSYRESAHADLAGTVHAAHLLAAHTLHPKLLSGESVLAHGVFEQLGVFPDDRAAMLAKLDQVRSLAGI
jgi:HD-like signal output (HDOD) protein